MKLSILFLAAVAGTAAAAPHSARGDSDGFFTYCDGGKGILCKNEAFDTVHRCSPLAETDQFRGWLCGDKLTKVNWHLHRASGKLYMENRMFCDAVDDGKTVQCK